MKYNLDGNGLDTFLLELRVKLVREAGRRRSPVAVHAGRSIEDGVQQVLVEAVAHIVEGAPLKRFKTNNRPVLTLADLERYALRRLRTLLGNAETAQGREVRRHFEHPDVIRDGAGHGEPVPEHHVFDREFLLEFLREVRADHLALRFTVLMLSSQLRPGTADLDPCNNTRNAGILGCRPGDVRNARYRLETIKNRILDRRSGKLPKDPSDD